MADPKLTIIIEQKGADGVVKSLKEIQKVGDTTYTKITKDGKLLSETTKTVAGAHKLNYNAVTALNQGYTLLGSVIASIKQPMMEMLDLALKDEDSMTRRNTAVLALKGATEQDVAALEKQVKQFQRSQAVGDDYTRTIQAQLAAQGVNKEMIDEATTATIGLAHVTGQDAVTASKAFARFLQGSTDTIRGTTIEVDKNTDAQGRMTAAMKVAGVGLKQLSDEASTNAGQVRLAEDSWSEFKESIGRLFTTKPAMEHLSHLTDSLNAFSDWIDSHQAQISAFADTLSRIGLAGATYGISEMTRKPSVKVHGRAEINYMAGTRSRAGGWGAFGRGTGTFSNVDFGGGGGSFDFLNSKGAGQGAAMLGGLMSGGIGGLGAAAGGIFGGPLGALLGGGIGRTLGGLFGGHKKPRGETPGQPVYTQDVVVSEQLRLLNNTMLGFIGRGSRGVDNMTQRLANQRAGVGARI